MRPIKRLERRELILGESQKIESIEKIVETTLPLPVFGDPEKVLIRFTFLDKKEIEFKILEQTEEDTILELTHSDIKKYKIGKYLVKTDDIKRSLSNIRNQVKVLAVPRECEIRELAESEINTAYKKGSGFYQLTKPEKIQAYKKILIMEKNKQAVYGGDDARNILIMDAIDSYDPHHINFP